MGWTESALNDREEAGEDLRGEYTIATPKRIQRKRSKGWRMPAGCVYVGRPSRWGNPFRPYSCCTIETPRIRDGADPSFRSTFGPGIPLKVETRSIEDCLVWYRWWASIAAYDDPQWLAPLRNKNLCCWCPLDRPCHVPILLELSNR